MIEWEAIFLETPRLFEPAEVIFRGRKCQTSHLASVEKLEDLDPMRYRVKTMTGSIYVGPIGTWTEPGTDPNEPEEPHGKESYS